jgi:hypothetical protein
MAPNSLFPCSANIFYRTVNAPHMMTLPLTEWSPVSGGHVGGTNLDWLGGQADTDDFITDFVTLLLPFFDDTTTFNSYTINTYADAEAPARPQVSRGITGAAGTGGATIPAAQATFNYKTTNFGTFRIVMLDARVSSTFQPLDTLTSPTYDDEIALNAFVLADTTPIAGRDGYQVSLWKRTTYTLNEKLRDSYHLD